MLLGYNTNGFAHHDLFSAVEVLAGIGYRSLAITLDHATLNPFDPDHGRQVDRVRDCLQRHAMASVVETVARYLLDPAAKHEPTLLSSSVDARQRRVEFLCQAVTIAAQLESQCVSLWSGRLREPMEDQDAWDRLCDGLSPVLEAAGSHGVTLGFEPEPGMFVAKMQDFECLLDRLGGSDLMLTLDVGHLHCQGETPVADQIRRWRSRLVNVHIEDMCRGVHEHLMFGEGEMEFLPIFEALEETSYGGGVHVELSRHSYAAPLAARQAFDFLQPLVESASGGRGPALARVRVETTYPP